MRDDNETLVRQLEGAYIYRDELIRLHDKYKAEDSEKIIDIVRQLTEIQSAIHYITRKLGLYVPASIGIINPDDIHNALCYAMKEAPPPQWFIDITKGGSR
jgi:hypothetical protein